MNKKISLRYSLKIGGNIKEIEKELGISYPTVRNKLEDVISALGYSPKYTEPRVDKKRSIREIE